MSRAPHRSEGACLTVSVRSPWVLTVSVVRDRLAHNFGKKLVYLVARYKQAHKRPGCIRPASCYQCAPCTCVASEQIGRCSAERKAISASGIGEHHGPPWQKVPPQPGQ